MATTHTKDSAPFEAAFEQIKDLNEQFVAAAKKAGNLALDSYEKAVDQTIALELRFAGMTQQEWLKSLIETQADVTREFANSYTDAARTLLK